MTIGIGPAKLQDLPRVLELLKSGKLPVDGLSGHLNTTLVLREGERVGGCVALEIYSTAALLRSLVVKKQHRGKGWGKRLTHAALEIAQEKGVKQVYLLTETARDFFAGLGFKVVDRSEVPLSVRSSVEFTSACPVSATAMMFQLRNGLL